VPGALVALRGAGPEQHTTTDAAGNYAFTSLKPGKYLFRVAAKGFTAFERQNVEITRPTVLDAQLLIEGEKQVVNVAEETNAVSAEAADNGSALVLKEKELAALSDDPDELSEQLQALAGPGGGRPPPYPHLHLCPPPPEGLTISPLPCAAMLKLGQAYRSARIRASVTKLGEA